MAGHGWLTAGSSELDREIPCFAVQVSTITSDDWWQQSRERHSTELASLLIASGGWKHEKKVRPVNNNGG